MWMEGRKVYAFAKTAMANSCLRVLDPGQMASKEELVHCLIRLTESFPIRLTQGLSRALAEDLEARLELPMGPLKIR